jgi:hypothetical protein
MDPSLLIATQSAGYAINIWQSNQAAKMIKMGANLDRQQLDLRMQQETLASTETAIANTEQLRSTLASQATLFAARGQAGGQGSARSIQQSSIRAYGNDERARQLNLYFKKAQIQAQKSLVSIEAAGKRSNIAGGLLASSLNTLSFNSLFSEYNPLKLNTPTGNL